MVIVDDGWCQPSSNFTVSPLLCNCSVSRDAIAALGTESAFGIQALGSLMRNRGTQPVQFEHWTQPQGAG